MCDNQLLEIALPTKHTTVLLSDKYKTRYSFKILGLNVLDISYTF